MDNKEILFEKVAVPVTPAEEVSIVTIFNNSPKAPSKKPVKIMSVAPIIITVPGPLPYTSDKAFLWHYGADVYVLGVKQEFDTSTGSVTSPGLPKSLAVEGSSHLILRHQLSRDPLLSHLPVCLFPLLIKLLPLLPSHLTLGAKGLLLICMPGRRHQDRKSVV